ncbi:MAG: MFS transporter [Theionarchaea archaeon]|nr:MFS transporter [Theionarchaea archaeon]
MAISTFFLSFVMGFLRWYLPIRLILMGNAVFAGLCFAIANIDDVIFSLLGGILADRKGRKPVIMLSTSFYLLGTVLLFLSFQTQSHALIILLLSTVFLWGVTGLSSGTNSALIAESTQEHQYGTAFSTYAMCGHAGTITGSFILALVLELYGVSYVCYLIMGTSFIGLLITFWLHETLMSKKKTALEISSFLDTFKSLKTMTFIVPVLIFVVLNGISLGTSGHFFSIFMKDGLHIDEPYIGSLYAFIPLIQLLFQPIAGIITDKKGYFLPLFLGNCIAGIFLFLFAFRSHMFIALSGLLIFYGLGPFHNVGYQSMIAKLSSHESRATTYSALLSVWNLMFVIGPLLGGLLYGVNSVLPFIFSGILLLMIIIPLFQLHREK